MKDKKSFKNSDNAMEQKFSFQKELLQRQRQDEDKDKDKDKNKNKE